MFPKCRICDRIRGTVSGMNGEQAILKHPQGDARVIEGADVDPYLLGRFGFDSSVLRRAVTAGAADAAMTTKHSPATAFGSRFWEGSIRQLRDDLAPAGWRALRPGQLEVVRNEDNTIQITTGLGDANVGVRASPPSCEHPRGISTARAVETNQQTFAAISPDCRWDAIQTWWLLYRPDQSVNGLPRCEFSVPISMSGSKLTKWAIRVIVPFPTDTVRNAQGSTLPTGSSPIDLTLTRRSG